MVIFETDHSQWDIHTW